MSVGRQKTAIAFINGANAPYRLNFHRRLAREVPGIQLHSLFTHERTTFPWDLRDIAEIRPVLFGAGEDCPTEITLRGSYHEWRKAGRMLRYIAAERIGAVVVGGYSDAGRVRVILACRRRHIPVLLWGDSNVRGDRIRGLRRVVKSIAVRTIVRCCSAVLVCGSLGAKYYQQYGARSEQIFRCPCEPDYGIFGRRPECLRQSVSETNPVSRRRRLVFTGQLIERKRVDLLLLSFVDIATERQQWDLAIIGDGPQRDYLQSLVPASLRSRIAWLGFIPDEEGIARVYRDADVLVLPSDAEPWGVVVTEAAASGLALVTSDAVGASADLVVSGVNGWTFKAGDRAGLTGALRKVTSNPEIAAYKAASVQVFEEWHRTTDPVDGFQRALDSVRRTRPTDSVRAAPAPTSSDDGPSRGTPGRIQRWRREPARRAIGRPPLQNDVGRH